MGTTKNKQAIMAIVKVGSENGATFTPSVSADGVLSWTNDKGLDNPESVNIKGDPYTLTEADKAEIVVAVIEALGGEPIHGYIDENNHITLKGVRQEGEYTFSFEMEDGSTIYGGEFEYYSDSVCFITNNLTNCTTNNSQSETAKNSGYVATISANSGYELKSLVVTMGGTDITSSAVSGGNINIGVVTGDIVITAVAEEKAVTEPVTVDIALTDGIRIGSDGGDRTQAGYCATPHIDLTNIPKPCTIHLTKAKWLVFDGESNTIIRVYAKKADGTQLISDVAKEGIGGSYFTVVDNSDIGNDVIVTITSNDVGYIRFSGQWAFPGASDSDSSFVAANTKATLTYTPVA